MFDDGKKDITLDVSFNAILIFFLPTLLLIPYWHGIVNTFELVVCLLDAHNFFMFNETNIYKYKTMKLDKQEYIYSGYTIATELVLIRTTFACTSP